MFLTNSYFFDTFILSCFCDAPKKWQLGFQDPATPTMEGMILFNGFLSIILLIIGTFVCWMLIKIINLFVPNKNTQKFTLVSILGILWALIPATILLIIGISSFSTLYSLDELITPSITLKTVGHPWY